VRTREQVPMLKQTMIQCTAAVGSALYTAVASYLCLKITAAITGGLRAPEEGEEKGMDLYSHDEVYA